MKCCEKAIWDGSNCIVFHDFFIVSQLKDIMVQVWMIYSVHGVQTADGQFAALITAYDSWVIMKKRGLTLTVALTLAVTFGGWWGGGGEGGTKVESNHKDNNGPNHKDNTGQLEQPVFLFLTCSIVFCNLLN